jgi:hypothetical protein
VAAPQLSSSPQLQLRRPVDGLLADRVELFCGWLIADEGDFALRARVGGRDLDVYRCHDPAAPDRLDVHGFWGMLFVQQHLERIAEGALRIELFWRERPYGAIRLRVTPLARHLATGYPLDLRRYAVSPGVEDESAGAAAPVVELPGLGAVGGATLSQLFRLQMLRDRIDVDVHGEAEHAKLWARACAAGFGSPGGRSARTDRWIDGHSCYGAARALGRPFERVTLLREPLRRLCSVHDYRALVHPEQNRFACFADFVASGEARRSSQAWGLLRLAGREPDPRISDEELFRLAAAELARSYALVGITERFEESLFLICQAMRLREIGMWWRVLSAPRSVEWTTLPRDVRRAAERAVAADLRLYEQASTDFAVRARGLEGDPDLARYHRGSSDRRELSDVFKTVECLRWRQTLSDLEGEASSALAPGAPR